jgi:hypothetical protein
MTHRESARHLAIFLGGERAEQQGGIGNLVGGLLGGSDNQDPKQQQQQKKKAAA